MELRLKKAAMLLIWLIRVYIHRFEPDANKPTAVNMRVIMSWMHEFGEYTDEGITVERPPSVERIAVLSDINRQAALYALRKLEKDGTLIRYKGPERRWVIPWTVFDGDDRIRVQWGRFRKMEIEWENRQHSEKKRTQARDIIPKVGEV